MKSKLLTLLLAYTGCLSIQAQDAERVDVTYRTLGWDVQAQFITPESSDSITVLRSQFSTPLRHTGSPVIHFYPSNTRLHKNDVSITATNQQSLAPLNSKDDAEATPPTPSAVATLPTGAREILLIFTRAPKGDPYPYRVMALDDSQSILDARNLHFYNLCSSKMHIKAFDNVREVAPGGQTVWEVHDDQSISSLVIAVTNPQAEIVYSSRFRIRNEQRLVLLATKNGEHPNGTPKIKVSSILESTRTPIVPTQPLNQVVF